MRFNVPQFIEIEDKIFGPLTFKQFLYVAGGAGLCFLLYNFLPFFIAILLILPLGGFALALAFYKVNEKPFINTVESAFRYVLKNKLYVWKKENRPIEAKVEEKKDTLTGYVPKLSDSKLKDLSWSLDVVDLSKREEGVEEVKPK